MRRTGQYLAVESVLTFGMGLILAIGTISAFTSYKDGVLERAESKQVNVIEAKVSGAIHSLEPATSGETRVDLPSSLAGKDYQVILDDGLKISTSVTTYSYEFPQLDSRYTFTGSAEGGTVKIYKNGDKFTVRAN